jgi:hypothetical protein
MFSNELDFFALFTEGIEPCDRAASHSRVLHCEFTDCTTKENSSHVESKSSRPCEGKRMAKRKAPCSTQLQTYTLRVSAAEKRNVKRRYGFQILEST